VLARCLPGSRPLRRAVAALGLLAAASNCAFLFRPLSGSRLDPLNSFISELEVPGQPASAFFREASLLSGVLTVLLAAGLLPRLPPGRTGLAGVAALALFGAAGAVDALIPMDCAPSASVVCLRAQEQGRANSLSSGHTWFDVLGTIALLASIWLFGRHLRPHPGWRTVARVGRTGFGWLTAETALLAVLSFGYAPGLGVAQRLHVLAVSGWLVVLAIGQAREPAATPERAASSDDVEWSRVGPNGRTVPDVGDGAPPG
jgi:hypothetical protein